MTKQLHQMIYKEKIKHLHNDNKIIMEKLISFNELCVEIVSSPHTSWCDLQTLITNSEYFLKGLESV